MALAVISDLFGDLAADAAAAYTEYERQRDPKWDPFAALFGLVPQTMEGST